MNRKMISGMIGVIVGGVWLASNFKYFEKQGFVAIGMPALIFVLGIIFLISGLSSKRKTS